MDVIEKFGNRVSRQALKDPEKARRLLTLFPNFSITSIVLSSILLSSFFCHIALMQMDMVPRLCRQTGILYYSQLDGNCKYIGYETRNRGGKNFTPFQKEWAFT